MKKIFASLALVILSTVTANSAELKLTQPMHNRQNVIVISGTGVLEVRPDIAIIHMSVVTRAVTAAAAQAENAVQSQRLIETLIATYNLGPSDIKTTSYTVTPEYNKAQPPELIGYVVRHSIAVTMRSLENLGGVLDTAIASGASSIEFIQYGLANEKEYQLQALKLAVQDARAKADAIAESIGRSVIRVIRVSQGETFIESEKQEVEQDNGEGTEIIPGNVTITATLTVEYQI